MAQYIDKNKVVEKIEKRFDEYTSSIFKHYDACKEARAQELGKILTILNTLDVKELDLEKEIDSIWNPRFNLGWDDKSLLSINHEGFTNIAKHFYELVLAQKGK